MLFRGHSAAVKQRVSGGRAQAISYLDQFSSTRDVQMHVEHVMDKPSHVFEGREADHKLIVRSADGAHPAVALEVEMHGGKYRVRSAFKLTDVQMKTRAVNSAGPGDASGGASVNPHEGETASRLWARLAVALPAEVTARYGKSSTDWLAVNRTAHLGQSQFSAIEAAAQIALAHATEADLKPLMERLTAISEQLSADPIADSQKLTADLRAALQALEKELPALLEN